MRLHSPFDFTVYTHRCNRNKSATSKSCVGDPDAHSILSDAFGSRWPDFRLTMHLHVRSIGASAYSSPTTAPRAGVLYELRRVITLAQLAV